MRTKLSGGFKPAFFIGSLFVACSTWAADPTAWVTLDGNLPIRFVDGNVQCASTDGVNCLWGTTASQLSGQSNLKSLACGDMHEKRWGTDGYSQSLHWCGTGFARNYATWYSAAPAGVQLLYSVNPKGDIQCLSTDGVNCLWGTTSLDSATLAKAAPLACGKMHQGIYGMNGYSDPYHWCATIRAALGDGNPAMASPNPYSSRNNKSVVDAINRQNITPWTTQADMQKAMANASVIKGNSTGNMLNINFPQSNGVPSSGYDAIKWQITFLRFEPNVSKPETRYVAVQGGVRDNKGAVQTFYFGINMPNLNQGYTGQARISLFGAGGVSNSSTCNPGADGGSGFSCSVEYVFTQGHTYEVVAAIQSASGMPGGYALTGTIRDETTGVLTALGSFGLQNGVASLDLPIMWAEGTDDAPCSQIGNFGIRLWPLAMYTKSSRIDLMPKITSGNCSQTLYKTLNDGSTLITYGPWVTSGQ